MDCFDDRSTPSPTESFEGEDWHYDDSRVLPWIESMKQGLNSDDDAVVAHALKEIKDFVAIYSTDSGWNQDSIYYSYLLVPQVIQRLYQLFFHAKLNVPVADTIDAMSSENWHIFTEPSFVRQLTVSVADLSLDATHHSSITRIIRRLVAYGDANLKQELLRMGLVDSLVSFVSSCRSLDARGATLFSQSLVNVAWAASELLSSAEEVSATAAESLSAVLMQLLQSTDVDLVSEVVSVMHFHSFSTEALTCLCRRDLTTCLLWVLRERSDWHSPAHFMLVKSLQVIRSAVLSHPANAVLIVDQIQRTWTLESFFTFFLKQHQSRGSTEVELAIDILSVFPPHQLVHQNLVAAVLSFTRGIIHSQVDAKSRYPPSNLNDVLAFIISISRSDAAHPLLQECLEANIISLLQESVTHFGLQTDTVTLCLEVLAQLLDFPDSQLHQEVVSQLSSSLDLLSKIEEQLLLDASHELSNRILSFCCTGASAAARWSGDVLHLMHGMRLG